MQILLFLFADENTTYALLITKSTLLLNLQIVNCFDFLYYLFSVSELILFVWFIGFFICAIEDYAEQNLTAYVVSVL